MPQRLPSPQQMLSYDFSFPQNLPNVSPLVPMTTDQHLEQLAKLLQNPLVVASLNNEDFRKKLQAMTSATSPVSIPAPTTGKRKYGEETIFSPQYPTAPQRAPTPPPNSPPPPHSPPPPSPEHGQGRCSAFAVVKPHSAPASPVIPVAQPAVVEEPSRSPSPTNPNYASFASFIAPNGGAYAAFPEASAPNSYSSALHQLVLLQHWVPILEKLSPANKASIWDTCIMMPSFKNYNKNSFRKTINAWATNILPNMASITVLFGAVGYLKHHGVLKNEFCFPNSTNPVFRTFITNAIPTYGPKKASATSPAPKAAITSSTSPLPTLASPPASPPLSCDKECDKVSEPCWKRPRIMELASIINA